MSYSGTVLYSATLLCGTILTPTPGQPVIFSHAVSGSGAFTPDGTIITGSLGTGTLFATIPMSGTVETFDFTGNFPGYPVNGYLPIVGTVAVVVIKAAFVTGTVGIETITGTLSAQASPNVPTAIVYSGPVSGTVTGSIVGGILQPLQITGPAGNYVAVGTVQADANYVGVLSNAFSFTLSLSSRTYTLGGSQTG